MNAWFNKQPPWFRIVVLPVAVTASGLFILKFSQDVHWLVNILFVMTYVALIFTLSVVNYANSENSRELRERYEVSQDLVQNLGKCVSEKQRRLIGALSTPEDRPSHKIAVSVRRRIGFENSISTLNYALFTTILNHLRVRHRLNDSKIFMTLLVPDESGFLCVLGDPYRSQGCIRSVPRTTMINVGNTATMAGRLWDAGILAMSSGSTEDSSKDGRFLFVDEAERRLVRSIMCYKIHNPITGEPFGLWSIDADRENVFPDEADEDAMAEITQIFNCFSERISLEIAYRHVISMIEPHFSKGIDEDGKGVRL